MRTITMIDGENVGLEYDGGIKIRNWGKNRIELDPQCDLHLVPTEFHFKDDGAKDNGPSMAIILEDGFGGKAVASISLKMFEPVLKRILEYSFT